MSCSKEPNKGHGHGADGRVYHGLVLSKENSPNRYDTVDDDKAKKLLNLKWDHIGLS